MNPIESLQAAGLRADITPKGRWTGITFPPLSPDDPQLVAKVLAINAWTKTVMPWLLEDISPNPVFVVASRFNWLTRLAVWWLNLGRRAEAKKRDEALRAHLARARRDLSPLNVAHISMQSQHNNTTDAPN